MLKNSNNNEDHSLLNKLFSDIKNRFEKFMTKLGIHVTHMCTFICANAVKCVSRLYYNILNLAKPKCKSIFNGLCNINKSVKKSLRKTSEKFFWIKDDYDDKKANEGFFHAVLYLLNCFFSHIYNRRKCFVTAFNWAAPVLSIVFLLDVINGVSKINYGVSVQYNGQELGIIAQETVLDEAEKTLQKRINYVDSNEKVSLTPKLSVKVIQDAQQVVNPNQLVDKMIVNSDADIVEAVGVYVDGRFLGSVADEMPIKDALKDMLSKYMADGVKRVQFQKNIEYKPGIYMKSSFKNTDVLLDLLTSYKTVDAYYTIQDNDTPIKIANKNNLSYSQLLSLNPDIEKSCKVGDTVLLNVAEPYMSVEVVKDVQYTKQIDYETVKVDDSSVYKGNTKTLVNGKEGEELISAEVTTLNGVEVSRNVTSTSVLSLPVTEKIAVGTKISKPSSSYSSGSGQYCWPVAGGYVSDPFGGARNHKGVDIAAPAGTSIFAASSGKVIMAQWYSGYGKCIMIKNDDGNVTVYGHQSSMIATVGQRVEKGQLIGLVGATGQATGNHLHFEVRVNGSYVNPIGYIK